MKKPSAWRVAALVIGVLEAVAINDAGQIVRLQDTPSPTPRYQLLLDAGLVGLAGLRKRLKR